MDGRAWPVLVLGMAAVLLPSSREWPPPVPPAPATASAPPREAVRPAPSAPLTGARLLASRRLLVPVEGIAPDALRDTFSDGRANGRTHKAIDILAARGTPVLAADDGTIARLSRNRAGGLMLDQKDPTGKLAYSYAHLDSYAPGLREGMPVRRGMLLGRVGSSGNATTPHLHFAVHELVLGQHWWRGTALNPYEALRHGEAVAAQP